MDESDVVKVTSLSDILGDPSEKLEPLTIVWVQGGKVHEMEIEVKRPTDYESFPIRFMTEKQESIVPEYDENGKEIFPQRDAPDMLLRRECVVSPVWLHNKREKLDHKLSPEFFSQLHRRLMLIGGVDGDFFVDWAMLQTPRAEALRLSASRNTSGSSRTKSTTDATDSKSPPTTSTSETSAGVEGSSDSPTQSGTASPSPTSGLVDPPKTGDPHRTQPSAESSTPNPSPTAIQPKALH